MLKYFLLTLVSSNQRAINENKPSAHSASVYQYDKQDCEAIKAKLEYEWFNSTRLVVKLQNNNRRRDADSISNTARLGRRIIVLKFSNYYLTKSMRLDNISDEQIAFIENRLNNRPRKTLGWKTTNEVLAQCNFIVQAAWNLFLQSQQLF